jgi:hypothetical protein
MKKSKKLKKYLDNNKIKPMETMPYKAKIQPGHLLQSFIMIVEDTALEHEINEAVEQLAGALMYSSNNSN